MSALAPCDVCLRRARSTGGNGTCSVYRPAMVWIDNPRREIREPEPMAWPKHLKLYPDGCGNFRPGDRRQAPEDLAEAIEGQLTLG